MEYFVKNNRVHRYPIPANCLISYTGEELEKKAPEGFEKCDICFKLFVK